MIYLDNAATTFVKPRAVTEAMLACMRQYSANPGRSGHSLSIRAGEEIFAARQAVADLFHAQPERVVFTVNCTQAINTALKGTLKKGDHVVISSLEHNSVLRPLEKMRQNGLITYDVAAVDPQSDDATVKNFEACIKKETVLIFSTHVSNVFGTVLPIEKLAALAKRHGLLFGIDAAQSAGVYEINMEALGADFVCLPGHKGLFGPMGTGALILGKNAAPESLIEGGTGSLSLELSQPTDYPDRLESGTLNLPGIVGLRQGICFVRSCEISSIHSMEVELIRVLREDLSLIKQIKVFDDMQKEGAALLSFRFKNIHSEETAARLNQCGFAVRGGYHCSLLAHTFRRTTDFGTVRVSVSPFNTKNEIKKLIFCLNQIAMT